MRGHGYLHEVRSVGSVKAHKTEDDGEPHEEVGVHFHSVFLFTLERPSIADPVLQEKRRKTSHINVTSGKFN